MAQGTVTRSHQQSGKQKQNKPSKSKQTRKKWNHCLIVPAIDSECSIGKLSKYCRVFCLWSLRKELSGWPQENQKCLLFCLREVTLHWPNQKEARWHCMVNGMIKNRTKTTEILIVVCSLPGQPRQAAQKKSSDETAFCQEHIQVDCMGETIHHQLKRWIMDYFSCQVEAFPRNKMTAFETDKTLLYHLICFWGILKVMDWGKGDHIVRKAIEE